MNAEQSKHTSGPTIGHAIKAGYALGYGPVRRQWFAIGADKVFEPSAANMLRGHKGTERQRKWMQEGEDWARMVLASIAKAEGR